MFRVQCRQLPIPPWKSTTSGPLPLVRTAIGRASLRAVRSLTWGSESVARLAHGGQDLPARLDGLGVDEDDREQAGGAAAVDPVVDRAPLHHDIAGLQVHEGIV